MPFYSAVPFRGGREVESLKVVNHFRFHRVFFPPPVSFFFFFFFLRLTARRKLSITKPPIVDCSSSSSSRRSQKQQQNRQCVPAIRIHVVYEIPPRTLIYLFTFFLPFFLPYFFPSSSPFAGHSLFLPLSRTRQPDRNI